MRGASTVFVGWKKWISAAILASVVTFGSARAFDWGEPTKTAIVTPITDPLPIDSGPPDTNPTPPSEAPEPATLSLALAGVAVLLVRRRK